MPDAPMPSNLDIFSGREDAFALVVSGPSGVGKTSVCSRVIEGDPRIEPVVTTTTRDRRNGEVDGEDYHFVTEDAYDSMLSEDAFLEHASVHGRRYGITKRAFAEALHSADVVLLEIDVQGAETLRKTLEGRCAEVFILPPSIEELRARLTGRKSESPEVLETRMTNAVEEMSHAPDYDYVIVNHDLDQAIRDIESVVRTERSRPSRQRAMLESLNITDDVLTTIQGE